MPADKRIESMLQQVARYSGSDFQLKGEVSGKGDELDALTAGVNVLGEMLLEKQKELDSQKQRMGDLMEILLRYAVMDFSHSMPITERGDEVDALAAGVNALVDELNFRIQKAEESEERFRLLVENAKDFAFFLVDVNGNVVTWNKGAEKIKGYKADEIIGKPISTFYTEEEIENGEPSYNLEKARELGRYEVEGIRKRKDGSLFFADIVFTPLYDAKGELKGYSKVTRDITNRKNAEYELKAKEDELIRSNTELEQFAYVASHDLQEPLRMVTSYVQLLEKRYKDKLDSDANEFIGYAVDGAMRMRTLINSLLEYSRVNKSRPFEKVNTNVVLAHVLSNLKEQITATNAVIKSDDLPEVNGDTLLMEQLFQNLITNAIKFKGEKDPVIEISGKKYNNEILFSVRDNGIGIQDEYASKIFVIFQRLHSKEKYPGTGIGLAIGKKIVERHGGRIWIESEMGKGTTFYFTIK